jgi:hypothetical protein
MATVSPSLDTPVFAGHAADIKLYSHSLLLYWWPVWAVAFLAALWTAVDHYPMAPVPAAAEVQPDGAAAADQRGWPPVMVARSSLPGYAFVLTLLLVAVFSNSSLRGLWAFFFGACVVALILLMNWLQLWAPLFHWMQQLRIHLNLAGYLAIAVPLFLVWVVAFFFFDRRTYMIFSASQLRVCDHLGAEEKVFDSSSIALEKKPFNWFHRLVGWGAGDLILKAGGTNREAYEFPNVIRVGKWLDQIERRLKTRDVE